MKRILQYGVWLGAALATVSWAGPSEEVNAAIDKFLAARSFHASLTVEGARPMSRQVDFVAPGRYRMRMVSMDDQYIIGDILYVSVPGNGAGKIVQIPMPKGTLSQWRDPAGLAENAAGMSVTALGEEAIGDAPTRKYRVDHTKPQPSTLTLWIGRDGYPLQIVSSDSEHEQPVTSTIRYSRFNDTTIRVDAPK